MSFTTISSRASVSVDICSNCHPFYTGQQKFVDTEGRIEKFEKKRNKAQTSRLERQARRLSKKEKKQEQKQQNRQPTIKEMLQKARKATENA